MKRLLIILLLSLPLSATTYYVDNCSTVGSDSNNGTATSTPWLTVAKVNAAALVAGDTVLFHKNCRWLNDPLIPVTSGSAGNPITYDSYGTGTAKPALTNGYLTSGWVGDTGGFTWASVWSAITQQGGSWASTNLGAGSTRNMRNVLLGANISGTNSTIRLRLKPAGQNYTLDDVAIGAAGTKPSYTTAGTRITFNGGQTGVTVPAGQEIVSDAITFNFNTGTDYIVALWWNNRFQYLSFLSSTSNAYFKSGGSSEALTQTVSGYSSPTGYDDVENIEVPTARAPVANVYQATIPNTPSFAFRNNVVGTQQTAWGSMNCEGCWLYDGSSQTLYWYTTTPITASDTIIAMTGVASSMISFGAVSYLTFNNLEASGATSIGAAPSNPGASTPANHIVYSGMSFNLNSSVGLYFQYCQNNSSVSNSQLLYNGYGGVGDRNGLAIGGSGAPSQTCSTHDIVVDSNEMAYSVHENIGVSVDDQGQSPNNITFTHNYIHDSIPGSTFIDGVATDGLMTGFVFAYNIVAHNPGNGLYLGGNAFGHPAGVIYNNVFAGNGFSTTVPHVDGIYMDDGDTITLKNNVFFNNYRYEFNRIGSTGSLTTDYNDFYHAAGGNFMSYNATPTTFAGWKTASSGDSHSISNDPLFHYVASEDYRPITGSPLLDAGVDLTSTYQMAFDPASLAFPYAQLNQNSVGAAWDIGAYAGFFTGIVAPPLSLGDGMKISSGTSIK